MFHEEGGVQGVTVWAGSVYTGVGSDHRHDTRRGSDNTVGDKLFWSTQLDGDFGHYRLRVSAETDGWGIVGLVVWYL